jgi:hypothetical protein
MPRKWTRRECFEHFGASCKNPQWSWSAKSADGRVVVMCMWQDEIKREGDRMVYQSLTPRRGEENRPGAGSAPPYKEMLAAAASPYMLAAKSTTSS